MPENIRQHINVDELQQRLTVGQVSRFYGFALPPNFGSAGEQRMPCPCRTCLGKGDRSVAINVSDPHKRWKCFRGQYGCGAAGNLVMLAYCLKHGEMPSGGKVKGRQFYEIAKDLKIIADGVEWTSPNAGQTSHMQNNVASLVEATLTSEANVPLMKSENEGARKLEQLDHHFVRDPAEMSAAASAYCRRRPALLSDAIATECRCGFLPSDRRSTLRGKYVYGIMDENGDALAWVGRNLRFQEELKKWKSTGSQGPEPVKYRFPKQKLFRRGLELYGQEWVANQRFAASLNQHGLIIVEGFAGRLRLHQLGVMSVAIMSNHITEDQMEKAIRYAQEHAGGRIQLMFDLDDRGDEGCKETLWKLHQRGINASLLWSHQQHDGRFTGKEPESLTQEEWNVLVEKSSANARPS